MLYGKFKLKSFLFFGCIINVGVWHLPISTFFIIINKKPPSPQFTTTTLGGGVHMNDLARILGIYDAKVKLKSINDHTISFYIYTDTKPHICPHCNLSTSKVHDYRMQKIKDIPFHN